ncbi:hypothetical protein QQS21_009028 [Conoideocrella luteorostrata]|uniref:Uncharacterized protein n=1 Tax=Conoideocrella luteorostrata TaxID=1105319 RepID=A0AAJ0FW01_9HYPO|nr:hypothetical protein QQS21_009028 [Conoideocrella luteorostrata]
MDYTDDACKTEFSPGQISRLHSLWQRFRRPIKDCGSSNFTEENCGTKLFCQLYDMPNTRPDNRFKNGLDCLADREPDKFCALYGHPQKPDDRFKNVADCLAALSPELKCMMYDLPKSRRPDSRFNDRSDCQADLARSCHIYNDPLMRPDERFKDGTDCLVNQAPDKFCQLYDTDQRPDNAFKNRADCLEERAPVMFCLLYDYPKLKPDDKFKNRSECVTARRIKSSPTNNNNNNKVRSAISAT